MDKKQTIMYFVMSAVPLLTHFVLESLSTFLQRFNLDVRFFSTFMVLAAVMCIINAGLTFLAKEKFDGLEKLFMWVIIGLGLVAGFLCMMGTLTGGKQRTWFGEDYSVGKYIWATLPVICCIAEGIIFFFLYGKFRDSKILPFLSMIVCFGLFILGLPFSLLGYYVHYLFAGFVPFMLALATVIGVIRALWLQAHPKPVPSGNGGGDGKPKRYRHLTAPEDNDNEPDLYSMASSIASDAKYYFGSGLSNVYPGNVDYSTSGNTIYLTFHYSCKRNEYAYTPDDSDILRSAENAADRARRSNHCGASISVSIYCDQVYTGI